MAKLEGKIPSQCGNRLQPKHESKTHLLNLLQMEILALSPCVPKITFLITAITETSEGKKYFQTPMQSLTTWPHWATPHCGIYATENAEGP